MAPKYTIDTCSFTAMRRVYPEDVFPGAWRKLTELAHSSSIISIDEVLEELQAEDDEVSKWAKQHAAIFLPLDADIQTEATKILANHRTLVDLRKPRSGADPFVIAAAIVHGCSVVTEEKTVAAPAGSRSPTFARPLRLNASTCSACCGARGCDWSKPIAPTAIRKDRSNSGRRAH
jgi:hypothetical protein